MQPGPQPLHGALQGNIFAKQPPLLAGQRRGIPLTLAQRELEGEPGAVPRFALERQRAPHLLGQLVADGQAQPGATEASGYVGLHLLERGEQAILLLFGDTDAGVADRDGQSLGLQAHLDADLAPLGELDRIVEQVGEHLTHPHRIDAGLIRHLGAPVQRHSEPLAMGQGGMAADHVTDDGGKPALLIMELQLARLYLGEVEHIVDQIEQVVGGGDHVAQQVALILVQLAHLQQLQHAMHAGDGGSELVAHGGEEAAAHLHRLLGVGPRLPQLMLLALEGRDVLDHPVEDQVPLLLRHETAAHLQVARPLRPLHLDLEIERGQGLSMVGHLADEVLQRLLGKAEHLPPRLGRQHLLPAGPQDLARPLRGIEEAPLAGSDPEVLIDDAWHAVGDLGEAGLRLAGPRLGLLDAGHVGQHGQDTEHVSIRGGVGALGIDDVEHGAILAAAVARPLQLCAALPHLLLLFQYPSPLSGRHAVQIVAPLFHRVADEGIPIGLVAQGDALLAIPQHHHVGQGVEQGLHKRQLLVQFVLGQLALHYLATQGPVPAHEQQHAEQEGPQP